MGCSISTSRKLPHGWVFIDPTTKNEPTKWQWEHRGNFRDFEKAKSAYLEQSFQRGLGIVYIGVPEHKSKICVDFTFMRYQDTVTRSTRRVRRVPAVKLSSAGATKAVWDMLLASVHECGLALEHLPSEFATNRDVVLAAVRKDGCALQFAPDSMKADRDLVLAAVECDGLALAFAADALRGDKEVVMAAALRDISALQFASAALQADAELEQAARNRCRRGLIFDHYSDFKRPLFLRQHFDAVGASIPGGAAYPEVIKKLNSQGGGAATVWFDKQPVFGISAASGAWAHPLGEECGRDDALVPEPNPGRDPMWDCEVEAAGGYHAIPEPGSRYPCWCCHWLRMVRSKHEAGHPLCCVTSNVYMEEWIEKHGAGSSELSNADALAFGVPCETFRNGRPQGWGEGSLKITEGTVLPRKALVHQDTKVPLGQGCRWERQALDHMPFPVYCFFMP